MRQPPYTPARKEDNKGKHETNTLLRLKKLYELGAIKKAPTKKQLMYTIT